MLSLAQFPASNDTRLRRSTRSDLNFILGIEQEAAESRFVSSWTARDHIAAFNRPERLHLVIENAAGSEPLGFLILAGIGSADRSIELLRIVIAVKGRGIGRQAVRLVKELAFENLAAHRLWLDVKELNTRARSLYLSEGFMEEGTLRECIVSPDGFDSLVLMSILESEYRSERQTLES